MKASTAVIYALKLTATLLLTAGLARAETPDGFAVYSKGDDFNRTLYLREMTTSGLATEKKICNKGSQGGDIQCQISFDGKWVAFSRSLSGTGSGYGGNDYHGFEHWDVYIVRVDGNLPATPKRVAHGYWPSWGDDSYNSTKTLYYSKHPEGEVRAVTVDGNGNLTNDRLIHNVKNSFSGNFQGFLMAAPNGQFCAARWDGGVHVAHWAGPLSGQKKHLNGGCMPSVAADSKWIFHANFKKGRYDGSATGSLSGAGDYHYGSSPDMKWFVTRTQGNWQVQNDGYEVWLFKLNVTETSASIQKQVMLTNDGSWCDIHAGQVSRDVSIDQFWAEPSSITTGSSTTLKWEVSNATAVKLNGSTVSGTSKTVSPTSTTDYTLTVEGENGPVSKNITVTVNQPALTTIEITPANAAIAIGGSADFTAATLDQSGNDFDATVSWSVSDGGDLSASSGTTTTFTSNGTAGQYVLTAQNGSVSSEATITVTDPDALHLKINCGSKEHDVDGWERDDSYMSGGSDYTFGGSFSTAGVTNAAPAGVYKSVVHYTTAGTSHSYSFPSVPKGTYTVRMHFSDGVGGDRKMNYTFEGTELISNLDIDDEAGGTDKALVKEVTVEVTDDNGLRIECSGTDGSDVFEAGIEIIAQGSSGSSTNTITVDSTYAGKTYDVGETLTIEWAASDDVGDVLIEVTPDGGKTWLPVTGENSVKRGDTGWGAYEWQIPADINGTSLVSDQVSLKVMDYLDAEVTGESGTFTIAGSGSVLTRATDLSASDVTVSRLSSGGLAFNLSPGVPYRLSVLSLNGKVVFCRAGTDPAAVVWDGAKAAGTYLLELNTAGTTLRRRLLLRR